MPPPKKSTTPIVRRVPTQERSRKRVEAILDAAAVLFSEVGFDATTMDAVADKAGTSVGSLYQFFPNKLAVFEALAVRCLERARELLDALFATFASKPVADMLDLVIEGIARLREADPAFRALLVNYQLYGVFEKADVVLTRYVIGRVEAILKTRAPDLDRSRREVVATTIVNTVTGAIILSQREKPAMTRKLLAETKVVLLRYLEAFVDEAR